ncbi:MAG: HyaD/HybD family hydrogenase maturation endopeptidase [Myxococcota bacterium]
MDDAAQTVVLGLGNILMKDDGAGVVTVDRLRRGYEVPPEVAVLDGGTLGLFLLPYVERAEHLILVDAVRADGKAPGTRVRLTGAEVPSAVATRLSPHQVGVADLLSGAHLIDRAPQTLVLLGVVPGEVNLDTGRTPPVEAAIDGLVEAVVSELAALGFEPRRRDRALAPDPLTWRTYAAGRPR